METIRQVLSRIQWDASFGQGDFEIGIFDRFSGSVEFVPLSELQMEKGNHFSFSIRRDGEAQTIPFHRIREVRKNGECIWKRPGDISTK